MKNPYRTLRGNYKGLRMVRTNQAGWYRINMSLDEYDAFVFAQKEDPGNPGHYLIYLGGGEVSQAPASYMAFGAFLERESIVAAERKYMSSRTVNELFMKGMHIPKSLEDNRNVAYNWYAYLIPKNQLAEERMHKLLYYTDDKSSEYTIYIVVSRGFKSRVKQRQATAIKMNELAEKIDNLQGEERVKPMLNLMGLIYNIDTRNMSLTAGAMKELYTTDDVHMFAVTHKKDLVTVTDSTPVGGVNNPVGGVDNPVGGVDNPVGGVDNSVTEEEQNTMENIKKHPEWGF